MKAQRWWHVAILGVALVLAALALVNAQGRSLPVGALSSIAVIVVAWFTFGRHAEHHRAARIVFVPLLIVASGVGTAFDPSFATVQCVVFPLLRPGARDRGGLARAQHRARHLDHEHRRPEPRAAAAARRTARSAGEAQRARS